MVEELVCVHSKPDELPTDSEEDDEEKKPDILHAEILKLDRVRVFLAMMQRFTYEDSDIVHESASHVTLHNDMCALMAKYKKKSPPPSASSRKRRRRMCRTVSSGSWAGDGGDFES